MKKYVLMLLVFANFSCSADYGKGKKCYLEENYSCAFAEFKPLAEQGNASAQNILGAMYSSGLGVKQDDAEAVKWYRKAAEQGNTDSQNNLGVMYEYGQGVKQNKRKAKELYGKACNNKNSLGCKNYKILNEQGY